MALFIHDLTEAERERWEELKDLDFSSREAFEVIQRNRVPTFRADTMV